MPGPVVAASTLTANYPWHVEVVTCCGGRGECNTSAYLSQLQLDLYRMEQHLDKQHMFPIMLDVFDAFIKSNQYHGQHYTLANLLTTELYHKRYYKFFSDNIPYLATIYTVDLYSGPQLTKLKLPNDGFPYRPMDGVLIPPRHKSDDWVMLGRL